MAPYVGAKLLLFAAVLLFGQFLRARLRPLRQGFQQLAAVDSSPELDQTMRASLARSRPYSVAIWVALLSAALLGVLKPGAPVGPSDDDSTVRLKEKGPGQAGASYPMNRNLSSERSDLRTPAGS
jgi:hypothetical protein